MACTRRTRIIEQIASPFLERHRQSDGTRESRGLERKRERERVVSVPRHRHYHFRDTMTIESDACLLNSLERFVK